MLEASIFNGGERYGYIRCLCPGIPVSHASCSDRRRAVTPTLHHGDNSERASDELDFICRSGHADICHEPLLSHAGELFSRVSTLAQRRLGQLNAAGASAVINSRRTYVVRLRTCRLPAVFRVTICHPLAPNAPSRTHLREQNLSQGREVRPIVSSGAKDSNPQTERSASWILQP